MSNHELNNPGGCYYHHCASISIGGASTTTSGGSTTATGSAGETSTSAGPGTATSGGAGGAGGSTASGSSNDESSGCGVTAARRSGSALTGVAGLFALAAFARRRRRQS
jgi:MYXO-CTERM domain-containing protein